MTITCTRDDGDSTLVHVIELPKLNVRDFPAKHENTAVWRLRNDRYAFFSSPRYEEGTFEIRDANDRSIVSYAALRAAVSPGGHTIALQTSEHDVELRSASTYELLSPPLRFTGCVKGLLFSPAEDLAVTAATCSDEFATETEVSVYNAMTGAALGRIAFAGELEALAIRDDGREIAAITASSIREYRDAAVVTLASRGYFSGNPFKILWSRPVKIIGGAEVAFVGGRDPAVAFRDGAIVRVVTGGGAIAGIVQGHEVMRIVDNSHIFSLAAYDDVVATTTLDGISFWRVPSPRRHAVHRKQLDLTPSGRFAVRHEEGYVTIFDSATGRTIARRARAASERAVPDRHGELSLLFDRGRVKRWNVRQNTVSALRSLPPNATFDAILTGDGRYLVTVTGRNTAARRVMVTTIDIAADAVIDRFGAEKPFGTMTAAGNGPRIVFTAGETLRIRMRDAHRHVTTDLGDAGQGYGAPLLSLSPDGGVLAIGSDIGMITIRTLGRGGTHWRVDAGERIQKLRFDDEGKQIAIVSGSVSDSDTTQRLMVADMNTGRLVYDSTYNLPIRSLGFGGNPARLIVSDDEGALRSIEIDPTAVAKRICREVGRSLNEVQWARLVRESYVDTCKALAASR